MGETTIEWTAKTWNPLRGCSRVSPGCEHCYAEAIAARFSKPGQPFHGFAKATKDDGGRWTRKVALIEDKLGEPAGWREPARVFVNSMSDLFHESLTFEEISRVVHVMEEVTRHTYQVLTKRPERMAEYNRHGIFPAHIWSGTSVENQKAAEDRIPHLKRVSTRGVRFLSCEPLLGPLDLRQLLGPVDYQTAPWGDGRIHWVIVGGESGRGARPCDVAWIRSIVQQSAAAGVACFVKQLGAVPAIDSAEWARVADYTDRRTADVVTVYVPPKSEARVLMPLRDKKGGDPTEWPDDLRVRQFPEVRG